MEIVDFFMKIGEWLWKPVGRQLGYMVHYRRNIVSLNAQVDKLAAIQTDNQESVNSAYMNGEIIKSEVGLWLKEANVAVTNGRKLNADVEANKKCFGGRCPDLISRYRLSKKAVKDMEAIKDLQREGRFERVSLEARKALGIESIMPTGYFEAFESTKEAMHAAMEALKDAKVTIIGVYGMGGVGKTTMVEHVAKQASKDGLFDLVIKTVVTQTPNFMKIQGQLADMLALKLQEETEMGRAGRLKERIMRGRRILIILDDVWRKTDLSKIGIPSARELEECESKVLLTSRIEHVCYLMESQAKIPLKVLSEQDSWILFSKKVGKLVESTDFNDVARQVARECGGLPVSLIAVAGALGDKDLEEWKKAARRLQMSRPPNPDDEGDVFTCIKLSYDYLKSNDAKSCFLLCCLFPEDSDIHIEDLVKYGIGQGLFRHANTLEEARDQARSEAKYLKASSMLLESEQEGCVRMHDVIRDTGISIASSGDGEHAFLVQAGVSLKIWPKGTYERYTTISLMWNEIGKIPPGLVCPKLQTLLLQNNSELEEIPDTFVQSLNPLTVLDMSGTNILSLPPSLHLLTNLHTLYLDRCQSISDVSIIGELKKLEILSLRESSLEELPQEIGQLTNLKLLDITMSSYIVTIPSTVISRLSQLEEIYMQSSFGDWGHEVVGNGGVNACFDELTCLSYLNILKVDIADVECIPKTVGFEPNWVKFDICISTDSSTRFMNVHLSKVTALHSRALLLDTTIDTLPDWFNNVVTRRAEKLFYITCRGLHNILVEYDHGRLSGVKSILVQTCYGIVSLMNTVTWAVPNKPVFESLVELRVHNMDYMKELCVGQLPEGSLGNLKFLEVQQCNDIVNALLPSNLLQRLKNLEVLDVSMNRIGEVFRCEGLEKADVVLNNLREMKLDNLYELTNIWNGPAELAVFHNLKILTVINCKKLRNLFTRDVSQCLLQLEELWLENCHSLEGIIGTNEGGVASKITFPQLKNLSLQDLPQLESFYSGSALVECHSLEHLHLQDCPKFRTSASEFHSRKQVQVNNEQHFHLLKKRLWELKQFA